MKRHLRQLLHMVTNEWKEYHITDIDSGIHIAAWIEDTFIGEYVQHKMHDSSGISTLYSKDNALMCKVELKRDPNSQDIHEIVITIRPEVIQQFDVLQKEMFDLLL